MYQEYINAKRASHRRGKKQKLDEEVDIKIEKMEETENVKEEAMDTKEEENSANESTEEKVKEEEPEEKIDERENDEPMARYEQLFNELLLILKDKLDPSDTLFTKLLLDAPELSRTAFHIVQGYCEDQKRYVSLS